MSQIESATTINRKILNMLCDKNTKHRKKGGLCIFYNKNYVIMMPKVLGAKFLLQIQIRRYSLVLRMIDIYRNSISANFARM